MRDERGQMGGLEGLAFGVLIFVLGVLVISNAWAAVDAKLAASAAARDAARAYVESTSSGNADSAARDAADSALRGYGRDPRRLTLKRTEGSFARCARVTFTASYAVSLGAIPVIGRPRHTLVVSARHSELVDPFRGGLAGEARCA